MRPAASGAARQPECLAAAGFRRVAATAPCRSDAAGGPYVPSLACLVRGVPGHVRQGPRPRGEGACIARSRTPRRDDDRGERSDFNRVRRCPSAWATASGCSTIMAGASGPATVQVSTRPLRWSATCAPGFTIEPSRSIYNATLPIVGPMPNSRLRRTAPPWRSRTARRRAAPAHSRAPPYATVQPSVGGRPDSFPQRSEQGQGGFLLLAMRRLPLHHLVRRNRLSSPVRGLAPAQEPPLPA